MGIKIGILTIILGACSSIVQGAADPTVGWRGREETELQEALRLSLQEYERERGQAAIEERAFQEAIKQSIVDYAKEQAKKLEIQQREAQTRKPQPEDLRKVALEQARLQREKSMAIPESYEIIVNNANVPIEHMVIVETKGNIVRIGKPRSVPEPGSKPPALSDRSLWEIPGVRPEGKPFIFSIVANNNIYEWTIPWIEKDFGNEFALIQEKVRYGVIVELKQILESQRYGIDWKNIPPGMVRPFTPNR